MTRFNVGIFSFLIFAAGVTASGGAAMAGDTGETTASLPSLVVSATRQEMPQSQVSSDITVITKEDISHLPVHDIGEALNYIPGLVFDRNGGPGSPVFPSIRGSEGRHVKILIDDIPLESLGQEIPVFPALSIENIERVEILKGSASSVWGSSLGGVINIVTREPSDEPLTEVGVSIGEENTRKYNAALSGKASGIGYLLSASRFETDGFFENQDAENNNIYAKLTTNFGKNLKAEFSYGHNNIEQGFGEWPAYGFFSDGRTRDSFGRVKLDYTPDKDLDLSLSIFDRVFYWKREDTLIGETSPFNTMVDKESSYGAILKSAWRHWEKGVLSAGVEATNGELDLKVNDLNPLDKDRDVERKALYLNESYGIGNLDLNLGARYDDDSVFGSEFSPNFGLVYHLGKTTMLRASAARGFTPPPLTDRYFLLPPIIPNPDLEAERAWTYQAGIEMQMPGLWWKWVFYRSDITDAIDIASDDSGNFFFKNFEEFRRQGVEVEVRTAEYNGLSLSYGAAINNVKNLETDKIVKNKAKVTHDVGLNYRGPFETRGTLRGHYVWWNADPEFNAKDKNFIWDAKVSKYLARWKGVMGEMFVSVHNIFSEKQYLMYVYPNPGTWWEGGVSLTFY